MKIGMRTIKTSIAVTISIALAYVLKLNSPFFAGIASIIAMQDNLVDSFMMGKNRVLGTFLGALIGLLGLLIFRGNSLIIGIGIGVIIVIYISNMLGWNKSVSIATIVFISIMLSGEESNQLYYSLNRILDTIVGIVVAVAVNFIISPPLGKNKIFDESVNAIKQFSETIKTIVVNEGYIENNVCFEEIEDKILAINEMYPIFMKEVDIHLYKKDTNGINLEKSRTLIRKLYNNMEILIDMGSGFHLDVENASTLNRLYGLNVVGKDASNNLYIVYNYHLNLSLKILEELKKMFEIS